MAPRPLTRLLPHVLLWVLVLAALGGLVVVLWPVASALVLAAAIAALVEPVLVRPVAALAGRWLPGMDPAWRAWLVAAVATGVLGVVGLGVVVVVLGALLGSFAGLWTAVAGVALQDPVRIEATAAQVGHQVAEVLRLYGGAGMDAGRVQAGVADLLTRTQVGSEVLGFLVHGTGGVLARTALVLVTVFYLLCQGPGLVAWVVGWLPLEEADVAEVGRTYRRVAYHLLARIGGRALVLGGGLGLIAWLIAGLNGVLIGLVATLLALLPLVGPLVAWVPTAGLVWSGGHHGSAIGLAVAGWLWCHLVARWSNRVAARLGTDQVWLEFLVFLGLVGGLLAHGPAGLVIGPAAVLAATVAVATVRQVHGSVRD